MGAHRRLPRPQQGSGQPRRETFRRNLAVGRGRGRRGAPGAVRTPGPRLLTPVRAPVPEPSSQLRGCASGARGSSGRAEFGASLPPHTGRPSAPFEDPPPTPGRNLHTGKAGGVRSPRPLRLPAARRCPPLSPRSGRPAPASPLTSAPGRRRPSGGGRAGSGAARRCRRRADCAPLAARRDAELQPPPAPGPGPATLPPPRPEEPGRGRLSAPPRARAPTGGGVKRLPATAAEGGVRHQLVRFLPTPLAYLLSGRSQGEESPSRTLAQAGDVFWSGLLASNVNASIKRELRRFKWEIWGKLP